MSANKNRPHVLILPEDDANSQIANGFVLASSPPSPRQVQILEVAGGWAATLDHFDSDQVAYMNRNELRHMVLLIDFDGYYVERMGDIRTRIPPNLRQRVFVLGSLQKPESLKQAGLGSFEEIGSAMARDCREGTETIWGHELLRHNLEELTRLRSSVYPMLFAQ